jgi:thiol-disulfide isomerase/thioredoxin
MKLIYLVLCISFSFCSIKKGDEIITVKGMVKNIPATKVYLTDAYNWEVFLDSADYRNDTFSFRIKPNNFESYLARISYINSDGKQKSLFYQNDILSTNDKKYGLNAFVLDKGVTTISGNYNGKPTVDSDKLKFKGSKQNDPLFKTQLSDFGWINTKDKPGREKIINNYKKLIRQYPYSYYFMSMLYNYRSEYTKAELVDMLSLFNSEAQHYSYNQKFTTYFKEMPAPGMPLKNFTLRNPSNQLSRVIDSSFNLNIIIFWASWCGPCRREIPKLKSIFNEFKDKGVRMVSISIDDNEAMWKAALVKEDMPWEQLIVDSLSLSKIKSSFNISSIPLLIFSGNKGQEIARFTGYDPGEKDEYTPIIRKHIGN